MLEINILPVEQKREYAQKRLKLMLSTLLYGAAIISLSGAAFLFFYSKVIQPTKISDLKDDTEIALNQIRQTPQVDSLLTVQNQLQALPRLHSDKPTTSQLFEYLSKVVPDNVTLTQLEINFPKSGIVTGSEEITMNGITTDLFALNVFIDILKNAEFSAVYQPEIDQAGGQTITTEPKKAFISVLNPSRNIEDTNEVRFQVTMLFESGLFDFDADQINFGVPNKTTTVSETDRPTDLFIDVPEDDIDTNGPQAGDGVDNG